MKKIIDTVSFNGEYDLLEIRLNILNDYVDEFVICEAPTTFTGNPKPLYFERDKERFKEFAHKIKYFVIDENYTEREINYAEHSPNTKGASHWKREFLQKESIKKALTHLNDDDRVFIGDCDEIWEPQSGDAGIAKLKLRVYNYYVNNRSNEEFWGTITGKWRDIKNRCLNHLRTRDSDRKTRDYRGWHLTNMGGLPEVRRKLTDSYTEESYNTEEVQTKLMERHINNQDYLGRNFTFRIDESELPKYLLGNKDKYQHLFKQ